MSPIENAVTNSKNERASLDFSTLVVADWDLLGRVFFFELFGNDFFCSAGVESFRFFFLRPDGPFPLGFLFVLEAEVFLPDVMSSMMSFAGPGLDVAFGFERRDLPRRDCEADCLLLGPRTGMRLMKIHPIPETGLPPNKRSGSKSQG